jgi:type II secretory ATPase GspE/PulE/Tfp pilus assembly ATPase PilB-like protein
MQRWNDEESDTAVLDKPFEAAVAALPASVAFDFDAEPIRFENQVLTVRMAREDDVKKEKIRLAARCREVICITGPIHEIRRAIAEAYPKNADDEEATAPQVLQNILDEAVRRHAADLFLDPLNQQGEGRCRMAIDGIMQPSDKYRRIRSTLYKRLTALIRATGSVQPANENLPGDGRLRSKAEGREIDLRISTLPIGDSQRVVMRVISSLLTLRDLEDLGMTAKLHKKFRAQVSRPGAFVTIAGPTGEGKSTTAYSAIKGLDLDAKNVCSIEQPVECYIEGVVQIPIQVSVEQAKQNQMTFQQAATTLLRQYPHFVFLGEMRDRETVEIAMLASTTGIALLSTIHAHDAIRTIIRLEALGASRQNIAQSMTMATSQRLLRRLCKSCRVPSARVSTKALVIADHFNIPLREKQLYRSNPQGCASCRGSGYNDRVGAFEMLEFTGAVRNGLAMDSSIAEIAHLAVRAGFRPMAVSALEHVANGETDEVELETKLAYDDVLTYMHPDDRAQSEQNVADLKESMRAKIG